MENTKLNDEQLDTITGGTIIFSADLSTCGSNCDNQYHVNNFAAVINFINQNKATMSESDMLKQCASLGYLSK